MPSEASQIGPESCNPDLTMTRRPEVQLRIPFATLLKLAFFALLVLSTIRLWPVILMVIVSCMLAAMLAPFVDWLERYRVRRALGITAVAVAMLVVVVLFATVVVPAMVHELKDVAANAPKLKAQLLQRLPILEPVLTVPHGPQMGSWLSHGLTAGKFALEGVSAILFVLVITVYLLVEGRQAFEWLLALAPQRNREKLRRTADEASEVAIAYVRGNLITSVVCAAWALAVLLILHVPAAVPLAVVAFVCDFVPVAGTIVMTVPAALLALTVSPAKATAVVGAYLFYHLVENYFIVPRVYGKAMRLSTLTVLLAVTAGGVLQGVAGAVLILPFVAAYPIVERLWLREHLPDDTVPVHEAIEEEESPEK
jgi:predicted PurR-regulated permease PerM